MWNDKPQVCIIVNPKRCYYSSEIINDLHGELGLVTASYEFSDGVRHSVEHRKPLSFGTVKQYMQSEAIILLGDL